MIFPRAFSSRCGIVLAALLSVRAARAHDAFASIANAQVGPDGMRVELTMARSAATDLLGDLPGLKPGLTEENFDRFADPLRAMGTKLFSVTAGKIRLDPSDAAVELNEENDVVFLVHYPRPTASPLFFHGNYFAKMPQGHTGTLYVETADGKDLGWSYLDALSPNLEVPLPAGLIARSETTTPNATDAVTESRSSRSGLHDPSEAEKNSTPPTPSFGAFLKFGVEHIITGYDHLLFLAGLLIACRRFGTMAGIITCFTLAHSITLALAALDVITLPSRIVEPLIAASIVFVGVENLLRRGEEPRGRWLLAFGFGLVHGFGFAGALKAVGLGAHGASLIKPLFSFNLGVELGQIAVATIFLPLLFQLRRLPNFVRYGLPSASSIVTLLGAYWLLQRTVLS